jgi:predicted transcriptional regulator
MTSRAPGLYPEQVFVSLSTRQLARLDAVADDEERSRSATIRRAIMDYVQRYEAQETAGVQPDGEAGARPDGGVAA